MLNSTETQVGFYTNLESIEPIIVVNGANVSLPFNSSDLNITLTSNKMYLIQAPNLQVKLYHWQYIDISIEVPIYNSEPVLPLMGGLCGSTNGWMVNNGTYLSNPKSQVEWIEFGQTCMSSFLLF